MESIPLEFTELPAEEMQSRARAFLAEIRSRRTVRDFSDREIPAGIVEDCIEAAGMAPSGANQQPWHFAVVREPATKRHICEAAEAEEREFYEHRAPKEWLDTLEQFGTDANKPFLETAPALIAVFLKSKTPDGQKTYYPKESVGIATGFLIAALHRAGLATLTHTPSPMKFLNEILGRPPEEKPFVLLVVGYPAEGCEVPRIDKLPLDEIASFQ